jgi:tetratricopeptide (TPR) repeat protein
MEQINAFGTERFPYDRSASPDDQKKRIEIMLARALNLRTVVAFVGSGCSAPLGYPAWKALVADVVKKTDKTCRRLTTEERGRLSNIYARLTSAEVASTRDLIFYLGLCQMHLEAIEGGSLHEQIAKTIEAIDGKRSCRDDSNPYIELMQLPIERFVTANYDRELERAIADARGGGKEPHWFTQERHGNLAGFAIAGFPEMRNAVFHCHGRYDVHKSIVASEQDYQQWYLTQRDTAANTFRQSLDLLFGSNPVLFLGFGMEDDDLLRPLRVFNADNPERKSDRLLFALSESNGKPKDLDWMESLHDRYGVNFIAYKKPDTDDPAMRGKKLCEEIRNLHDEWHLYKEQWWQKPAIREVRVEVAARKERVRPKMAYQHYSVLMNPEDDLAPDTTKEDLDKLEEFIQDKRTRVVVVTGDGGSGKSWRVLKLLKRLDRDRGRFKDGVFFWSSYYADDWLTGLDRALSYFESDDEPRQTRERRLRRFRDCLRSGAHLLVFDGFERLLRSTDDSKVGVPYSRTVDELLRIMVEHDGNSTRSTVILTSRLMPKPLQALISNPAKEDDLVRHFGVRRLTSDDLKNGSAFCVEKAADGKEPKKLSDEDLGRICSLCGGHSYALLLAARYLKPGTGQFAKNFERFRQELSRRAPDSRNTEVIKLAIEAADQATKNVASKLLDRLAIFMSPIDIDTRDVCFQVAMADAKTPPADNQPPPDVSGITAEKVVDALKDARLLMDIGVVPTPTDGTTLNMVTVHPTVRSYVFYKSHGVTSEAVPNFTLAGFTSGNAACHPGERGKKQILGLFDNLCTRALKSRNFKKRRLMARAAFGVMRSRMESNTVPRWSRYDEYLQFGLRLLNLMKEIARGKGKTWDYMDRALAERSQSPDGILYADELAWLYNDIGLALCSEGSMADAYSLWEQGFEINRVTDSEEEGGQYMVQSQLHMAHLFLELGRLPRASQFLTTTERANAIYGDPDFAGRILGYRGLLAHLAGNLDEADKLYGEAILRLTTNGRHNLRAESMFHRHWADLMMAKGDINAADTQVETALSLAREGNFPDLEAYARKSRAHVLRLQDPKDPRKARAEYNGAMKSAQNFGIKRLQADINSELARLALDVGDWETARIRAIESLTLANELSLGIRRTHGLVVLGLAMQAAGNLPLAISYLRHAYSLAQVQGYHLRGREAEQILQGLGVSVPTDPEGWEESPTPTSPVAGPASH